MESHSCAAPYNNINHRGSAQKTMARHAKSFTWAARLFPRQTATDVAVLYAFCRHVDDVADHQTTYVARHKLGNIRSDLDAAFSCQPAVQAFIDLAQQNRIDFRLPKILVDAIQSDTAKVRVKSWDDLVRYAYGVASTVGLMMCSVMRVGDPAALPFAVDLGIAMQLTNIARDVVDDAHNDRIYLPPEMLGIDVEPHHILSGEPYIRQQVADAREQLLDRAARYYRSADKGMRFIPFRARLAVMTAARLYEAIGPQIRAESIWGRRAFIRDSEKTWRTLCAVASTLFNPHYWNAGRQPDHDLKLHQALKGLPGTDRGL
ncbi:MAG: phytoene/squalene synthase family protein [Desulfobacterales bacterium]|jgi:phytoene synthase